ncbi:YHS domain-containing (seleno)protein [uncultured Roseibium sp.]|uniref:YHS domain-containing (seleno)protein n=1 Tax=uncultured Roseibium sp. TaxID=1936171 RepID=UPI00262DB29F|nr:YHS domain-containing (seleno)protein [uncultured Roseibium sp.]
MKTKFALTTIATAVALTLSTAAFAVDEFNVNNGLTLTGNPLGMHGIDPVTMFESEVPGVGSAVFTSAHEGVDYYFASEKAQKQFEADPEAYLPQFGGFCAFGVFVGKKLDGDVRFADIVDGKLYLFVNQVIFDKYLEQKDEVIAGAVAKWPEIRTTAVSEL